MDLKEILAVSGKGGLFKIISQTKNGLIVESMLDKKRMPVYATDKISNLEEISIYTEDKEVPLKQIFKSIYEKESGARAIDPKSDDAKLKTYFAEVLPDYDRERVYASDMKKVFSWYNILHENQMLVFTEEEEKKEEPVTETTAPEKKEKKAKATPPAKTEE